MKNRKRIITTLIGMTLTAQLSPVGYTIVNAQEANVVQGQDQQQGQTQKGLANTKILLGGNGCWETSDPEDPKKAGMHQVEISFDDTDPQNMKLKTHVISGYEGTTHSFHEWCPGEYMKIELLDEEGRMKEGFAMSGKDNIVNLTKELDTWKFQYGDSLVIYHGEGMQRTKIKGDIFDKNGIIINDNYDTKGVSREELNEYQFKIEKDGLKRVDQNIIEVNSKSELINKLGELKQNKHQATIKLKQNITFDNTDVAELIKLNGNGKSELTIPEGVTLVGDNGSSNKVKINLNKQASLVLKGNYTGLENIIIENSNKYGVQIYNSEYSSLKKVTVENSNSYGIYANGSRVMIEDCETSGNIDGGVLISTSFFINLSGLPDSNVTFKSNSNKITEKNEVTVKNLQLIHKCNPDKNISNMENNTFKIENPKMGTDRGPDSCKETEKDVVTNFNHIYDDKFKAKYPCMSLEDVKVKEQYIYYTLKG